MKGGPRSILRVSRRIIVHPTSRVILDVLALILVTWLVYRIRLDFSPRLIERYFIGVACMVIFSKYLFDCYSASARTTLMRSAGSGLSAVVVAGGLLGAGLYVLRPPIDIAILWRGNLPLILSIFALFTMAVQVLVGLLSKSGDLQHDRFFFGSPQKYQEMLNWADVGVRDLGLTLISVESVRALEDTQGYLSDHQFVVEDDFLTEEELSLMLRLRSRGAEILNLGDFYEKHWRAVLLESIPLAALIDPPAYLRPNPIFSKSKRFVDIVLSTTLSLILSPILLITCIFILVSAGRPVFFSQERTGLFGRAFRMHKLRTMKAAVAGQRLTTSLDYSRLLVGAKWIRKWRLDELPQLWNVLKGDMSLIGPRPERVEITNRFRVLIPQFALRELARPGLSGWAQVEYRYAEDVSESQKKLAYDLYYLKHQSFALDLIIFFKTIKAIVWGSGR
jgi:lipopolysaccharide/colanic/teichoic acid biosynthesis glycosyltransferase